MGTARESMLLLTRQPPLSPFSSSFSPSALSPPPHPPPPHPSSFSSLVQAPPHHWPPLPVSVSSLAQAPPPRLIPCCTGRCRSLCQRQARPFACQRWAC